MTTSITPTLPAVGPCPEWCELPAGHAWREFPDMSPDRTHTRNLDPDTGLYRLSIYEQADDDGDWKQPGDTGRAFIDIGDLSPQQDIDTAANLAVGMSDAVALAVGQMGCDEDTPEIRLVLAQREVLAAAEAWTFGDGKMEQLVDAVARLRVLRAEVVESPPPAKVNP